MRRRRLGPGDTGVRNRRRDALRSGVMQTKWEYVTAPVLIHATKQILDNWGEDGWELVQIVPGPNPESLVAYFKRPRSQS
ncbi:hypothetical protein Francci3_4281 [Frankia casuarinae]|uniref:DUF4177 domain-containing protein n=2 Tax=Frankiaceae TaxID=74712 RepID=Q2J515_FRACC|nr:hypothetical protein Francci3_4281 [Frankia casuarinae]